ncbi:MAG: hypothetical protein IKE33_00500 [Erysipelotrichaceae bacterium]|nr:hypothetical protein [Erysipelotrichaceae bacterium]
MKKIFALLLVAVMLLNVAACTSKQEEPEPEPVAPIAVPEDLYGQYYEEIAGKGHFVLNENGIDCHWSSSAFESADYKLPVQYDQENNRLVYEKGVKTNTVYESESKSTTTIEYEDGTGYFEIDGTKLIWHDDKNPEVVATFIKDEGLINLWTYTTDIEEAIAASGVEFDPPVAVPEGFELKTYGGCKTGAIEAVYVSEDRQLVVRKSYTVEGQALSGNYNEYAKNWNISLKGVSVDCYGNDDTINEAYFSAAGSAFYTVSIYNLKGSDLEVKGITPDELNSLINGMQ